MLTKSPFILPCLPTVRKEAPTGLAWVHEVKFDGYRLQLHKEGQDVALFSKNGNHCKRPLARFDVRIHDP